MAQRTRARFADTAGVVNISEGEILFSAAAARVLVASLPVGAVVIGSWVEVLTAFNAGTSNLVTVGWGAIGAGTADDLVATVTEGTPGIYPGVASFPNIAQLTAAQDAYVYYTPGDAAATTGKARAVIVWARTANQG